MWLLVVVVDDVGLDEVEVEVEDEDDEEEPLPVVVVVVVGGGAHDSELETTPAGKLRADSGVPGAWFGKVSVWPVINFTVIVHVPAARAIGINARDSTASIVLTVATATLNLRRLIVVARLLPPCWSAQH